MPGREGDGWKLHHTIMEYVIRYDFTISNSKRFLQVPSMVLLLLLSLAALASTAKVPLLDISV